MASPPPFLILDLGGVVFPSPVLILRKLSRDLGYKESTIGRLISESEDWKKCEEGEIDAAEFSQRIADKNKLMLGAASSRIGVALLSWVHNISLIKPDPRMVVLISLLRDRGVKVGAITNNFWIEGERVSHLSSLRDVCGRPLFDTLLESRLEGKRKDQTEASDYLFLKCAEKLGVKPQKFANVLYMDDLKMNLTRPAALGMKTAHVFTPEEAIGKLCDIYAVPRGDVPKVLPRIPLKLKIDKKNLMNFLKKKGVLPRRTQRIMLSKFSFGQSNPTYLAYPFLETHVYPGLSSKDFLRKFAVVIRKKPSGNLLPSAHQIEREFKMLKTLEKVPAVPVPKAYLLCSDSFVMGVPFFVMEFLPGCVFTDPQLPSLTPQERAGVYKEAVKAIAALHQIKPKDLPGVPRPSSGVHPLLKLTRVWAGQYGKSILDGEKPVENMVRLGKTLEELFRRSPVREDLLGVVHGDFRLDNCIFDERSCSPREFKLMGVVDWELSSLRSHVFQDLASFFGAFFLDNSSSSVRQVDLLKIRKFGLPEEEELFQFYLDLRGLENSDALKEELRAVKAFQSFKLGAILQGVLKRKTSGNASDQKSSGFSVAMVERLAEAGLALLEGSKL